MIVVHVFDLKMRNNSPGVFLIAETAGMVKPTGATSATLSTVVGKTEFLITRLER